MDLDLRTVIGLIATAVGAGVLAASYAGAWLLGRAHGRRETERAFMDPAAGVQASRIARLESAAETTARALDRLAHAQSLLVRAHDAHTPTDLPITPRHARQRTPV